MQDYAYGAFARRSIVDVSYCVAIESHGMSSTAQFFPSARISYTREAETSEKVQSLEM
jgi:hypothetical protein